MRFFRRRRFLTTEEPRFRSENALFGAISCCEKTEHLPRQARDTHREDPKTEDVALGCVSTVSKNGLFAPFMHKMHHFTKTGSGRKQGILRKRVGFFAGAQARAIINEQSKRLAVISHRRMAEERRIMDSMMRRCDAETKTSSFVR
jgi:hypothetical protein